MNQTIFKFEIYGREECILVHYHQGDDILEKICFKYLHTAIMDITISFSLLLNAWVIYGENKSRRIIQDGFMKV